MKDVLKRPKILIVGASMAGLTAAVALAQSTAFEIIVFERSTASTGYGRRPRDGGGIGLQRKSRDILNRLGIPDFTTMSMEFQDDRDRNGRILRRKQIGFSAVYWGDVHNALYQMALKLKIPVHCGKEVLKVEESINNVTIFFTDGTCAEGDVVIGADGILSAVRASMFSDKGDLVRHSGYYAWRGLARLNELPDEIKLEVEEKIPQGTMTMEMTEKSHAIFYYLGNGINWLIYINNDDEATPKYHSRKEVAGNITKNVTSTEVQEFFRTVDGIYRPFIAKLIRTTIAPFTNQIYDLDSLDTYCSERCVLIGDAAHAVTPHFTRGTNMAIQNSYALAKAFLHEEQRNQTRSRDWLQNVFRTYEEHELKRCNNIVLTSRRLGRIKQGVLSPSQRLDWDVECSSEEYDKLLQDDNES